MLKFPKKTEKSAKSVNDAIELALAELEVSKDEADIEIIDEGSKGFLGIGAKEAKVCVSIKEPEIKSIKVFLGEIFSAMNVDVEINVKKNEENGISVDIKGEDMGIIIGHRGDTLDALQYLTSLIVNHDSEKYIKVTMDTENYREKRTEVLISLSNRLAENVAKSGKKKTLEPMNPYERRVIHANLQDNPLVSTYSIGDEPYRKVVIAPKNPKPHYRKPSYGKIKRERPKKFNKRSSYLPEETADTE